MARRPPAIARDSLALIVLMRTSLWVSTQETLLPLHSVVPWVQGCVATVRTSLLLHYWFAFSRSRRFMPRILQSDFPSHPIPSSIHPATALGGSVAQSRSNAAPALLVFTADQLIRAQGELKPFPTCFFLLSGRSRTDPPPSKAAWILHGTL